MIKRSSSIKKSSTGQNPIIKDHRPFLWTSLVLLLFFGLISGLPGRKDGNAAVAVPAHPRWNELTATLSQIVGTYQGEVGLYIRNLNTGQTFEYQADRLFLSASLVKLPIMAATFQAVQEDRLTLDSKLKYSRKYRRGGSGVMKWARPGSYFSMYHLIFEMMTKSDNTAAAMLIDRLGYDYLNRSFERFGLQTTRINPKGMSLSSYIDPASDNYTTPREMGVLLEKIYRRQVASNGLSDLMLEIMKAVNSRSRLAQGLPSNWQLAHKTGLLRKNCHDVGIVFTPEGDYVICVLTSQNNNYKMAKGLISNVGRTTYEFLSNS